MTQGSPPPATPGPPTPPPATAPQPAPTAGTYWSVPSPLGYSASVDAAGTVAAPLLAGFSITFMGIILSAGDPGSLPLREEALAALMLAGLLLLACVQCAFWARLYPAGPAEVMAWWPDLKGGDANAAARHRQQREVQWRYQYLAARWLSRARGSYHLGILALLAGMALVLVPADHAQLSWRWGAVGIAGLGFLAELYWVLAPGPTHRGWPGVRRLFPEPKDVAGLPEVQPGAYTGVLPGP